MLSPELMRYIIDPDERQITCRSKRIELILKNTYKGNDESIRKDINTIKNGASSGIKMYKKILMLLQKSINILE